MATVKDTLWKCLLNFPTVFPNALSVYNHWFCVNGNGYEWKNGELVSPEYGDSNLEKHHNAKTVDEAIINCLDWDLVCSWDENGNSKQFMHCYKTEDEIANYIKRVNRRTITDVKMILNTDNRMKDFSIPIDPILGDKFKFKFYPLCEYSRIYTFPDDVTSDWLRALKQMVDLMEKYKELIKDPQNSFPSIKERVYKLYNDRYNKCEYLGDIYEIVGMDTEEVSAGCHSFDVDVYVCHRLNDGYTRTFDTVNRLI